MLILRSIYSGVTRLLDLVQNIQLRSTFENVDFSSKYSIATRQHRRYHTEHHSSGGSAQIKSSISM